MSKIGPLTWMLIHERKIKVESCHTESLSCILANLSDSKQCDCSPLALKLPEDDRIG